MEATRLISDWSKWLVTIETAGIAVTGALASSHSATIGTTVKVLGTAAVICFLLSIGFAAVLLLTLPEIVQRLDPSENIWLTRDSIAGRVLRLRTQGIAMLEAAFFALGVASLVAMIVAEIWS